MLHAIDDAHDAAEGFHDLGARDHVEDVDSAFWVPAFEDFVLVTSARSAEAARIHGRHLTRESDVLGEPLDDGRKNGALEAFRDTREMRRADPLKALNGEGLAGFFFVGERWRWRREVFGFRFDDGGSAFFLGAGFFRLNCVQFEPFVTR